MAILKDKKVVIIGDRDGIPGPAIAECVKTAGADAFSLFIYRMLCLNERGCYGSGESKKN